MNFGRTSKSTLKQELMDAPGVSFVRRSDDKLTLTCNRREASCTLAEAPLNDSFDYFEITIENAGPEKEVTLGFVCKTYTQSRHPGWDTTSIAYHGDNGKLYNCNSYGDDFGPLYQTGDVVGAGIDHEDPEMVVFTLNGGVVNKVKNPFSERSQMYPAVGLSSVGARVLVNLGQHPFRFQRTPKMPEVIDEDIDPTNLLDNPVAARSFSNWTIQAKGGEGWTLCPNFPPSVAKGRSWATSFGWCTKHQIVDLVAKGFKPEKLDEGIPLIAYEWHALPSTTPSPAATSATSSHDQPPQTETTTTGTYCLRIILLDQTDKVLVVKGTGDVKISEKEWKKEEVVFSSEETKGVRKVCFEHGAKADGAKKGFCGPILSDAHLLV